MALTETANVPFLLPSVYVTLDKLRSVHGVTDHGKLNALYSAGPEALAFLGNVGTVGEIVLLLDLDGGQRLANVWTEVSYSAVTVQLAAYLEVERFVSEVEGFRLTTSNARLANQVYDLGRSISTAREAVWEYTRDNNGCQDGKTEFLTAVGLHTEDEIESMFSRDYEVEFTVSFTVTVEASTEDEASEVAEERVRAADQYDCRVWVRDGSPEVESVTVA